MIERLLVCTDMDRTLIPNGHEPESPGARESFASLAARPEVTFAMVTGRDRDLVENAVEDYALPVPDFVIADVGTTLYAVGPEHAWHSQDDWSVEISTDWRGHISGDLQDYLRGIAELRLQEPSRQNTFKLSYYVPLEADRTALSNLVRDRLNKEGIAARLIWSVDDLTGIGLLDVLPARASKYHAIEALMKLQGFSQQQTVFCGDSGNDIEVLQSPLPSVLVANATAEVRQIALANASSNGNRQQLYIARGDFMGMNGCYAAGILEGIAHYHPAAIAWMGLDREEQG